MSATSTCVMGLHAKLLLINADNVRLITAHKDCKESQSGKADSVSLQWSLGLSKSHSGEACVWPRIGSCHQE